MMKLKDIVHIVAKAVGYDAVENRDAGRDAPHIEKKTEDELLKGRKRLELIATLRDQFRNTTFSPATALQLQVNAIGTIGGRLTVIADDTGKIEEEATRAFRHWAKHAEFRRGLSLNELLAQCLAQITHMGGDFIAVFDDGIITHADQPTNRVLIFESDRIKDVDDGEFAALYPPDENGVSSHYQTGGIVYDKFGRVCAAFVGNNIKCERFSKGEYLHLKLDVPGDFSRANWIHVAALDRASQCRGVSPVVHVANNLADLADMQGSEVQGAKVNSALALLLTEDTSGSPADPTRGFGEDDAADLEDLSPEDRKAVEDYESQVKSQEDAALKQAAENLRQGLSAIVKLDSKKKLESFKTDRPNLSVVEMYDRISDLSGTVLGLPKMFSRLNVSGSYSGARTEIVLARPVFRKWQKFLERNLLDWLGVRVLTAFGFKSQGLEDRLVWSWPDIEPVDEGAYQTALQKKFLNCEVNLIDLKGADRAEFIRQRQLEAKMFEDAGLVAPWNQMKSGGVIETKPSIDEEEKTNKEGEE